MKMKKDFFIILLAFSLMFFSECANAADKGMFDNLGFGVGLSFTFDTGDDDRVKSASVVNGRVRVDDEENGIPRIILEIHNFIWGKGKYGYGPFVAVQPGDDDIINSVALGFMVGMKYSDTPDDKKSFNLGIGLAADPNVQILGEGLQKNKPLPENETEIRFKEETQYGIIGIFSTSW